MERSNFFVYGCVIIFIWPHGRENSPEKVFFVYLHKNGKFNGGKVEYAFIYKSNSWRLYVM